MEAYDIIERLSATSSRIEKEQILIDAFMRGHRDFFIAANMAYDVMVTFGVKKVAQIEEEDDSAGDFSFDDFLNLADNLRYRRLTGHAARDAINDAAQRCHVKTWNTFYRRVLLKDFKCGVDTSTINKVMNKLADSEEDAGPLCIPVFSCQLAHDGMKPENQKRITGRKMLDVKLDGVRLITILDKDAGTVTQYARNGKVNENFPHLTDGLRALMDELPGSVVIDGEVISTSFQDLMKQFSRSKGKADTKDAKLAVFDMVPLADFKAGICRTPQEMRQHILSQLEVTGLLRKHTNGSVYVIPKVTVDLSTREGQATFAEFNRQAIDAGYEGIMVKDPNAPYELKRSYAWLKIKPFIEVTLEIVGWEEGTGKYEGKLGAWIMEGEDDDRKIKTNVGGGLSDKEREDYWNRREQLKGFLAEVRADALTLESGGDVWSLRFPRWKGLRGTEPGEKL
jgi:DNA ligase-1